MVAPVRQRRLRRAASPQSGVTLLSSFDYTGITICTFGPFTLDPSTRQLLRAGIAVSLSPKAFDALVYLIEHRDRVVRKDELLTAVWPDVVVQESSLTQLIFILRKALDPQGDGVEYIATASRYGYRFVAPIDAIGVTEAGLAESAVAAGELPSGRGARGRSARAWPGIGVAIAAGAVVVAAVTVATVYRLRARPEVHPIRMFLRPTENTMPPDADLESPPVISGDGRQVAFVARSLDGRTLLWIRALDALAARPLPGTEDAGGWSPFWSPDSRSIAFTAGQRLKRVDIEAGTVQELAQNVWANPGGWNAQGTILFSRGNHGIYRVPATGGAESLVLAPGPSGEIFTEPRFLPDGRHFLFLAEPDTLTVPVTAEVRVGQLGSQQARVLLAGSDLSSARYASSFLLFMRGGRLLAQRFDPASVKLTGESIPVPEKITHGQGSAALSTSDNGVLAYRTGDPPQSQLMWIDRTGRPGDRVDTPPGRILNFSLAPDGQHLAVAIDSPSAGGEELWIIGLSGAAPQRLPYAAGTVGSAAWSPDGSHLAFRHNGESGLMEALVARADARLARSAENLLASPDFTGVWDWARNGGHLLVAFEDKDLQSHLWALPLSGDRRPVPVVNTGSQDDQGQISPDGHWLAYRSRVSRYEEIYVQRFPVGGPPSRVSNNRGSSPRWRGDGSELYYLENHRTMMAVRVQGDGSELRAATPERLFDVHARVCGCFDFVASPDGQRFLVHVYSQTGESQPLVVVFNWTADLERTVR